MANFWYLIFSGLSKNVTTLHGAISQKTVRSNQNVYRRKKFSSQIYGYQNEFKLKFSTYNKNTTLRQESS
jgi:hypothetical protein